MIDLAVCREQASRVAHEASLSRNESYAAAYLHSLREHKEEALFAMLRFICREHPDAVLAYVGTDLGGPVYRIEASASTNPKEPE